MDRQHVKLVGTNEPVDDAVWRVRDLADQRILEFRNGSTRLREGNQSVRRRYEAGDDHRRIVKRVLTDERANRGQVGTSLLGPEDNPHDKNCFLTSS